MSFLKPGWCCEALCRVSGLSPEGEAVQLAGHPGSREPPHTVPGLCMVHAVICLCVLSIPFPLLFSGPILCSIFCSYRLTPDPPPPKGGCLRNHVEVLTVGGKGPLLLERVLVSPQSSAPRRLELEAVWECLLPSHPLWAPARVFLLHGGHRSRLVALWKVLWMTSSVSNVHWVLYHL